MAAENSETVHAKLARERVQYPVGSAQEQILSALRTAKNRLEYLTTNDWNLIIDKAKRVAFNKNETLVRQGKRSNLVYLVVEGMVDISASGTRIAQIGPGEFCGDMAFLEDSLASATATAAEQVAAYAIEWSSLRNLFDLFPHLGSRFYRSLAVHLSRRLRAQIMSKPSGNNT